MIFRSTSCKTNENSCSLPFTTHVNVWKYEGLISSLEFDFIFLKRNVQPNHSGIFHVAIWWFFKRPKLEVSGVFRGTLKVIRMRFTAFIIIWLYIYIAGCLAGTHHYRQFFTPFILIINTSMTLQGIHSFFFIPDSSMKKIRNLPDSLQNSIPSHFYENESFLPYSKPTSDVVFTHHLSMIKTATSDSVAPWAWSALSTISSWRQLTRQRLVL